MSIVVVRARSPSIGGPPSTLAPFLVLKSLKFADARFARRLEHGRRDGIAREHRARHRLAKRKRLSLLAPLAPAQPSYRRRPERLAVVVVRDNDLDVRLMLHLAAGLGPFGRRTPSV